MRSRIVFDRGPAPERPREWPAAIEDYTESLRLDPGYAEALVNRGNALDTAGRPAAALADYTERCASIPATTWRGTTGGRPACQRFSLGSPGGLRRRAAPQPLARRGWFNRAVVRAALGRLRGALEDLDRAAALRPDDRETFQVRSQVRRRLGDELGAREDRVRAESLVARPPVRRPSFLQAMTRPCACRQLPLLAEREDYLFLLAIATPNP